MTDERDGTQEEPEVEEAFVRALGDAARRLWNAPPEPPREEMWDEIQAARAAEVVKPDASTSRFPRPRPWWIGIAAALVIGVALGRVSDAPDAGDTPVVAEAGSAVESGTDPGAGSGSQAQTDAELLPYRFATTELLNRSETFLTMVRTGGAAGESADEVREWARPLLTRTRLLLGSPAATDPELRSLLDDLEIVLVQIAQLPEDDSEERGWIDEGMDESRLLFRLRAASAAGASTVRM